jgi:hypothetical protein
MVEQLRPLVYKFALLARDIHVVTVLLEMFSKLLGSLKSLLAVSAGASHCATLQVISQLENVEVGKLIPLSFHFLGASVVATAAVAGLQSGNQLRKVEGEGLHFQNAFLARSSVHGLLGAVAHSISFRRRRMDLVDASLAVGFHAIDALLEL